MISRTHQTPLTPTFSFPTTRLRRLRKTTALRLISTETRLRKEHLMAPFFVREGNNTKTSAKLPSHPQYSIADFLKAVEKLARAGGKSILLFGIPERKNAAATEAYNPKGIIQRAVREVKKNFGDDLIMAADLCFCEYTDHGHCGILKKVQGLQNGIRISSPQLATRNSQPYFVDNDLTLDLIGKTTVSLAQAGADIIAPSGMMDGQITTIRQSLDKNKFTETIILSYAAKYASALYGPFRELAESKPSFGDRKSYQMNPANSDEALREIALDIQEGADMVMVKPAMFYLDIIQRAKAAFQWPMAAYQVSGEAWMIEQYAQSGMTRREDALLESTLSIRRAGADLIISYFTQELLSLL